MDLPRPFIRLAWSNLAAQAADQISLAAVPLVAVLALGAGAGETGLLSAMQTLPFLLLSIPTGLLADRVARKRLMAGAEFLRAATLAALPVLAWAGWLSVPMLAVLGFAAATGTMVFTVTAPALVPALVPSALLASANARLELARSTAFAAGPALAGAAVTWVGASPAFALASALSMLACLLLAGIAEPERAVGPRRHVLADLAEGAAFVRDHALLRPILLVMVVWNTGWFVLQAVFVPFAIQRVGLDAMWVGISLGAYGVGMVVGAVAAPVLARRMRFGALIFLGPTGSLLASAVISATVWFPGPVLPVAGFFLFGAFPILWTITQITLRQAVTPPALIGRVSALMTMAGWGARPLGAALGGVVGTAYGVVPALLVSTAIFAVQLAMIAASPIPRLKALPAMA